MMGSHLLFAVVLALLVGTYTLAGAYSRAPPHTRHHSQASGAASGAATAGNGNTPAPLLKNAKHYSDRPLSSQALWSLRYVRCAVAMCVGSMCVRVWLLILARLRVHRLQRGGT